MMKRSDKINLLKAIQSKRITVAHLQPRELTMRVGIDDEPSSYFINNKEVNEDMFDEAFTKEPGYKNHTIKFTLSHD